MEEIEVNMNEGSLKALIGGSSMSFNNAPKNFQNISKKLKHNFFSYASDLFDYLAGYVPSPVISKLLANCGYANSIRTSSLIRYTLKDNRTSTNLSKNQDLTSNNDNNKKNFDFKQNKNKNKNDRNSDDESDLENNENRNDEEGEGSENEQKQKKGGNDSNSDLTGLVLSALTSRAQTADVKEKDPEGAEGSENQESDVKIENVKGMKDIIEVFGPCGSNLVSGQSFGESSLTPPYTYQSTFISTLHTEILVLSKRDYRNALAGHGGGCMSFDIELIRNNLDQIQLKQKNILQQQLATEPGTPHSSRPGSRHSTAADKNGHHHHHHHHGSGAGGFSNKVGKQFF